MIEVRPIRGQNEPDFAIITYSLPTTEDFDLIRARRHPVHVLRMPDGWSSLDFLDPVIDVIPKLIVTDYSCTDARAVARMTGLHSLSFSSVDLKSSVEIAGLPELRRYSGPWKRVESLAECTDLTQVGLYGFPPGVVSTIESPLEALTLVQAGTSGELPVIRNPSRLRDLRVALAKSLDLSTLISYPALRVIELESCRAISHPDALLGLPHLTDLTLGACRNIEGWTALDSLTSVRVRVWGSNPFDLEFREAVADAGNWSFPPGKGYLPPPRDSE